MNLFAWTAQLRFLLVGGITLTLFACERPAGLDVTPPPSAQSTNLDVVPTAGASPASARMMPSFIDYREYEGSLSHLLYRSIFTYSLTNQLRSIRDSLLSASSDNKMVNAWAQFSYTDTLLTQIRLSSITYNTDSPTHDEYGKPARFELTYSGQTIRAHLIINEKEVDQVSIELDPTGFPRKSNVNIGRLFLDSQGNLDYQAESKRNKEFNPRNYWEITDQQYDQDRNVFAESKEFQILTALLTASRREVLSSGIVGLDNALTTNNLVYRTVRQHVGETNVPDYPEVKLISKTLTLNGFRFPVRRISRWGAMGLYQYDVTYRRVD